MKHYKITVNADFAEVYPTEDAKIPSDEVIDMLLENLDDFKLWKRYFPSESWVLKGFTIISLVDCTSEVALSDLKSSMISIDPENLSPDENLIEIFKSYFDVSQLNFGLMLFNKKDQRLEKLPIYENLFTNHILDFWINTFDDETRKTTFTNLNHNSKPIVVSNIENLDHEIKSLPSFRILRDNNINSFMVIPIVKDNELLAIMEFTSPVVNSFNGIKLKKMEFFSDMILFSLNRFSFEKNYQIEAIIQREYTSIHDSVVWKFRNEAEKYFNASLAKKIYTLKQISFKNLTPLFGFSDIRSSSEKRFNLMLEDLNQQIEYLHEIFSLTNSESEKYLLALEIFDYPQGMPKESDKDYPLAKQKLEDQLSIVKNFKGKTLVIPGNHDWYSGLDGLKAQEDFVKNYLNDKKAFLPKNSCPIDDINLTKDIKLIVIDSEWALLNWDNYPGINKNCDIKTREDLFTEFKDIINKNQDKRIIVALHHPVISSGTHAGYSSAKSHLFPLKSKVPVPVVSSLINVVRSSSGANPEDINNQHYADLANRIKSIVQEKENIIFVSGHDHNLQYHEFRNIKQIISGAGSKVDPATIGEKTDFSYGGSGFAVLNIRKDKSSDVEYFSTKDNSLEQLSHIQVTERPADFVNNYPDSFPLTATSTVYPKKLTEKRKFYRWLWGEHYRKYYGMPIEAPTANISTLDGGYTPFREGGGNQSNSLRLRAQDGQEFVMRGVKKSAVRFLNNMAFKKSTFGNELNNTFPERFLLDFYTTSHPFTPFAIGNMADKIDLYHSNPRLYYIPKQKALGEYNISYGDEMYMIEERFSSDPKTLASLDNAKDIVSTDDVLKNFNKNYKYSVDQELYIRARLFDMLIGDWDRHSDQWKWAEYQQGDKVVYKPIPRDRDQAFSKYDGNAFKIIMNIPAIRHMKTFKDDIKSVKWLSMEPYPLDLIFLKGATEEQWLEQAKYIQEHLTDQDIDNAFTNLPKEVQDETIADIQRKLKIRKTKLETYASQYYDVLQKKVPLAGTVNPDKFVVTKTRNSVNVKQYKLDKKKENPELVFEKTYDDSKTKELWLYGLEDDDVYEVSGDGKPKMNIRLIGGYNHDTYNVADGKKVKIYDFRSQNNTYNTKGATKNISDDYDINTYNYKHPKYNFFAGYPNADYNPDDGLILGVLANYTVNNFIRSPYTQKHSLKVNFYTATGGFNAAYKGIFKKAIGSWDFNLDAGFTTPRFAENFFGLSNESEYDKENTERKFNRARISKINFAPSVSKKSWTNIFNQFQLTFENNKVQRNGDRFVDISPDVRPEVFDNQQFAGANYTFGYKNLDNTAFPTLGMEFKVNADWKTNLNDTKRNFLILKGTLSVDHRLDSRGNFVFANSSNVMWINNNNFEFYQAASIGGNNEMRAFRNDRFSGKSYFINNSEIRWDFGRVRNNIAPANMGVLLGYDVGRVWNDHEDSRKWHQSVGAGFWLSIVEMFSARLNYFYGTDGGRISGGVGMTF